MTRALTYAELAAELAITPASAKRLAQRHKWRKALGNDQKARVQVPLDYLEAERPALVTPPVMTPATELDERFARVAAELVELRVELAGTAAELAGAHALVGELRLDRDRWIDQARALAQRTPAAPVSIWRRLAWR